MVISDLADVATPKTNSQEVDRPVCCAECRFMTTAIMIGNNFYHCPNCEADICLMCGCTANAACIGGCSWISPGICSSHKEELQEMARRVFGGLK